MKTTKKRATKTKRTKTPTAPRTFFRIPIGDWSGDGHSRVEWVDVSTAKTLLDAREAYFRARKELDKDLDPAAFVCEYEDDQVDDDLRTKVFEKSGIDITSPVVSCEHAFYVNTDEFINYVIWFINQGDPELDLRREKEGLGMFPFYGNDKKRRHIPGFGYGLFSDG